MENNHTMDPLLALAIEAARAGEDVIRHYYDANLKISVKQDQAPVASAAYRLESIRAA